MSGRYFLGMAEEAGRTIDAVTARLDAVTRQGAALSEADRQLADAVAGAHAVVVSALEQLNHIQTEIDTVATSLGGDPSGFATDTPAGALEFQRFLLAKQREIVAVVERASAEAAAKAEVLERLRESYRVSSV